MAARKRDMKLWAEKQKAMPNLNAVDREEEKANAAGHTIVKIRKKSKVAFVQLVALNFQCLVINRYLTNAEQSLLLVLMAQVEMHSNAIVIKKGNDESTGRYASVSDLANLAGLSREQTARTISSFINKGIIYEWIGSGHKRQIRRTGAVRMGRPLFANPEIIIATDKNKIGATLARLVINDDILEQNGIKLPIKIWLEPGSQFGKMVKRGTYLRKKKALRESTPPGRI